MRQFQLASHCVVFASVLCSCVSPREPIAMNGAFVVRVFTQIRTIMREGRSSERVCVSVCGLLTSRRVGDDIYVDRVWFKGWIIYDCWGDCSGVTSSDVVTLQRTCRFRKHFHWPDLHHIKYQNPRKPNETLNDILKRYNTDPAWQEICSA